MAGTGIIPHSALAATNHDNKIRLYFQSHDGNLRESLTDDGSKWTTRHDHLPVPVKPKTFTSIACVNTGKCDLRNIHVFYIDVHHYISELVFNGEDWTVGELNKKNVMASSYSQLAAVHWGDEIRVYYQKSDNHICELVRSGSSEWTDGQGTRQKGSPGSRLAAIYTADELIRVYYQALNSDANVSRQVTTKNNWSDIQTISPPVSNPPHGAYAAVAVAKAGSKVYFQEADSKLYEVDGSPGSPTAWFGGSQSLGEFIPQSFFAAVAWDGKHFPIIRVYGQTSGDTVQEMKWDHEHGWRTGSTIPTK